MKRIDPTMTKQKFERLGITPCRGRFVGMRQGECVACALGIEAIDAVGFEEARKYNNANRLLVDVYANLADLTHAYARGSPTAGKTQNKRYGSSLTTVPSTTLAGLFATPCPVPHGSSLTTVPSTTLATRTAWRPPTTLPRGSLARPTRPDEPK